MRRAIFGLIVAIVATLCFTPVVCAQDFAVPILIDGDTYTLTVSVDNDGIAVLSSSDAITVGEVMPLLTPEQAEAEQGLDALKSQAITIEYDDLFRNNEDHVGKTVRFVGEVLEFQEKPCILCEDKQYLLRVAVTEGAYGIWDDPLLVQYSGKDRFLDEDIVTLWGTVEGLTSYTAVLGNTVTLPEISAVDIVLGEAKVPEPALPAATESEKGGTATVSTTDGPVANGNANLRGGPGTGYPVVGKAKADQPLDIAARNADASWLQLDTGEWIAAFLVDNLDAPAELPVVEELPEPPAPAAAEPSTAPEASTTSSPGAFTIGDEIQGNGWRFNVKEVHKRKSVYFYGDPDVAMGNWVVVIMDAVNEQSGTDYFANNVKPYLIDDAGNTYRMDGKASGYAEWQYGGLSSIYSDVDPGKLARIAVAYDVPEGATNLTLSTDLPASISLGNYSEMEIEE